MIAMLEWLLFGFHLQSANLTRNPPDWCLTVTELISDSYPSSDPEFELRIRKCKVHDATLVTNSCPKHGQLLGKVYLDAIFNDKQQFSKALKEDGVCSPLTTL